ncbi:Thiol:disulfide interchange protein DsbD precursor [Rubripirellula tenax]|uniref:Thiol:disulfide interchange protein DsbD n=1 Tax=Rubripirellula tenax TaxID=2528015 RepID=A0A5C6EJ74_9BACT|nr:protein-disulfide reductase DsbD domain-containing protein [Rubripirellula tenax]TWU48540.1 Thiol:disulfide interchange protein DsbD precursor [Rubripirellula tenax]
MNHRKHTTNTGWLAALFAFLLLGMVGWDSGRAMAQGDFDAGGDVFPNFTLGGFGASNRAAEPVTFQAKYYAEPSGDGVLEIEAELAPSYHIYSTTQPPGGPLRTKFKLKSPQDVSIVGDFTPEAPPSKSISSQYNGLTVEEHEDFVVWTAPIKVPFGFEDSIRIDVNGLVCETIDGSCLPIRETLVAQYGGPIPATGPATEPTATVAMNQTATAVEPTTATVKSAKPTWFRDKDYVVQWAASLSPAQVAPGGTAMLTFTAKPDKSFHVYRAAIDDAESSTNFVVTEKSGMKVGGPKADKPVISKSIVPTLPPVHYYGGEVSWTVPIAVPADAAPGLKNIEGFVAYQACTDNSCHRPVALKFATTLEVAGVSAAGEGPVTFASAKSAVALDAAAETKWVDDVTVPRVAPQPEQGNASIEDDSEANSEASLPIVGSIGSNGTGGTGTGGNSTTAAPLAASATSFPVILFFAFVGGVILNVMPCVLPVVGLKIMGFVSQAGEDRRRVLMLNLVYAAGILAVFAFLAMLAVVFKFGWGQQFTYFPVKLGLTLGLFALALSYLGVWEIPAPGMASNKASQELQSREGLTGAFSKGVFATVLATPCSGPLLGYILGLTLGLSSIQTVLIFMTVGLGMSLPYLLIGMQPKLISWLPKPGNWMETFKEFMAFLFLGTVAFFFAQFQDYQKLPVFVSLIGVWFGCWVIGQVPSWSELPKRMTAWTGGIAAAALISYAAFVNLVPGPKVLAWEDYSEMRLNQLQAEGKTVLLDFSAKWCTNCIYNYEFAINTEPTRKLVDQLDAVAMYADYTDFDEAIQQKLEELESRSIPLLAIYPGRAPDQPIILRDLLSQQNVLDALEQAGESVGRPSGQVTSTTEPASLVSRHGESDGASR